MLVELRSKKKWGSAQLPMMDWRIHGDAGINGMNSKWISSLQRIHIHATVASLDDDGKKCWKLEIMS